MILGIGQYNTTKKEEKYSLPLPGKQFGQEKNLPEREMISLLI